MHKSHKDPGWLLAMKPTAPHQQLLRLYCSCLQPAAPHSPPGRAARCAHGRRSYKPPMLLSALDPLPWATAGQVVSRLAAAWAAAAAPRGSDPLASSAVPGAPAWRGRCPALAGARGCLAAPPPLAGLGGAGGQGRIEGGRAAGGSWLRLSGVTARTVASPGGVGPATQIHVSGGSPGAGGCCTSCAGPACRCGGAPSALVAAVPPPPSCCPAPWTWAWPRGSLQAVSLPPGRPQAPAASCLRPPSSCPPGRGAPRAARGCKTVATAPMAIAAQASAGSQAARAHTTSSKAGRKGAGAGVTQNARSAADCTAMGPKRAGPGVQEGS